MRWPAIAAGALVGAATTSSVRADEPRFVPTAALVASGQSETMAVEVGGAHTEERRSDLRVGPAVGLAHRLGPPGALSLDGHASLGLAPALGGGRYLVPIREDVGVAWRTRGWLALRGGLGAGLAVDLGKGATSYAELALPVSVTLVEVVEIVYRPYLSLPIASEERATFGGSRSLSASVGVVPIDFALRFRVRALGF